MKPNTIMTPTTADRLATAEEIRAAVLPDSSNDCAEAILFEIASDLGGFIRMSAEEFEISRMVEELTGEQDAGAN